MSGKKKPAGTVAHAGRATGTGAAHQAGHVAATGDGIYYVPPQPKRTAAALAANALKADRRARKAQRLRALKWTVPMIAKELDCTERTVYSLLRRPLQPR